MSSPPGAMSPPKAAGWSAEFSKPSPLRELPPSPLKRKYDHVQARVDTHRASCGGAGRAASASGGMTPAPKRRATAQQPAASRVSAAAGRPPLPTPRRDAAGSSQALHTAQAPTPTPSPRMFTPADDTLPAQQSRRRFAGQAPIGTPALAAAPAAAAGVGTPFGGRSSYGNLLPGTPPPGAGAAARDPGGESPQQRGTPPARPPRHGGGGTPPTAQHPPDAEECEISEQPSPQLVEKTEVAEAAKDAGEVAKKAAEEEAVKKAAEEEEEAKKAAEEEAAKIAAEEAAKKVAEEEAAKKAAEEDAAKKAAEEAAAEKAAEEEAAKKAAEAAAKKAADESAAKKAAEEVATKVAEEVAQRVLQAAERVAQRAAEEAAAKRAAEEAAKKRAAAKDAELAALRAKLEGMKYARLQSAAKRCPVAANGKREDIIDRIVEFRARVNEIRLEIRAQ